CLPTAECAYTTEAGCEASAGTYSGHGLTCSGIVLSCPQPMSCCLPAALGGCLDVTQLNCATLGGNPGNTSQCGSTFNWAVPTSCGGNLLSRAGLFSHQGAAFDGAHLSLAPGFDNIAGLPATTSAGGGGQAG